MYNNKLACRKYYDKQRENPDYVMKKRLFARSQYYRKRHMWFYKIFQKWKSLKRYHKKVLSEEIKLYYIFVRWRLLKTRDIYNKELLNVTFYSLKNNVPIKPPTPQIMVCF